MLLALAGGDGGGSSPSTGSISGSVTSFAAGAPLAQVSMVLSGSGTGATATSTAPTVSPASAGGYTVTPSLAQATLSPASRSVSVSGAAHR